MTFYVRFARSSEPSGVTYLGACGPAREGVDDVVDDVVQDVGLRDGFGCRREDVEAHEYVETFEGFAMCDQERGARGGLHGIGEGGGEDGVEVGGEVEVGERDGHGIRLGNDRSKDEVDEDVGVLDVH